MLKVNNTPNIVTNMDKRTVEKMISKEYSQQFNKPTAIALGYFDSVHRGHMQLLDECKLSGYIPAIFTFRNNPRSLYSQEQGQIFTFKERQERLELLGAKLCISANFDQEFMHMSAKEFLKGLVDRFCPHLIVVGEDYSCGKNAEYSASDVKKYFDSINIDCKIVKLLEVDGAKISSNTLRSLIQRGDIVAINRLLPLPYTVAGNVERGRNDGAKILGFPTANISFPKDKLLLKEGVYHTKIALNGTEYQAITNVGNHPTFDDYNYNIESFILDFDEQIYDKNIKVEFIARIRDTIKFGSVAALRAQIAKDERSIRECKI